MGVTNLWQILQPTAKAVKIEDLKDKILAVDLSIWLCETSLVKYNSEVLKPYLRNVFFRCQHLLEIGCTLIFIREGDIIELKKDTMEKRNNLRFGKKSETSTSTDSYESYLCEITNALSLAANKPKIKKRSNFEIYINEVSNIKSYIYNVSNKNISLSLLKCCEMLNLMGIATIRSPCGEAEKSCAYLNLIGKCDAVISEDSDVLLYGAKTVYRNFSVDKNSETSIEEYSMVKIESKLGYTREMLISLALLLGCDYDPKGISLNFFFI
jgi:flap endonuclease GEN